MFCQSLLLCVVTQRDKRERESVLVQCVSEFDTNTKCAG